MQFPRSLLSGFAAFVLLAAFCPPAAKAGPAEIDAAAYMTLERFFYRVPKSRDLAKKAAGVLVFPSVVKAGFGFCGEYGEGALLIHGQKAGYYNLVSGSFGLQLGVQSRSVIVMFMEQEGLDAFRRRNGWKVGVAGSVTMVSVGAQGAIDTDNMHSPIVGFISDHSGLMAGVSLEGAKISRIYR